MDAKYSGIADVKIARTVGKYWASLRNSPDWIDRRVETTKLVDESHIDISVSLTIDLANLRQRVEEFKLENKDPAPIPLVALEKELQLALDVRNEDGKPIPVAVSDEDSFFGHAFLLAEMERFAVPIDAFSSRVFAQTHSIVRRPDGVDVLLEIINAIQQNDAGSSSELSRLGMPHSDIPAWNSILDNDAAFTLLYQMAAGYFLVVKLPLTGETTIIKYRRLASVNLYRSRFGPMPLGLKPLSIALNGNGIGTAQREHTRVIAPEGARIVGGELLSGGMTYPIERRRDSRRIVFYTAGHKPGALNLLRVDLKPDVGAFFVPAFVCSLLLTIFAAVALHLESADDRFSRDLGANVDATVAILVLLPTIFAILLIQRGEHGLVARMHAVPRAILLLAVIFMIVAAGGVAISADHAELMSLFFTATLVATLSTLYFLSVLISMFVHGIRAPIEAFMRAYRTVDES